MTQFYILLKLSIYNLQNENFSNKFFRTVLKTKFIYVQGYQVFYIIEISEECKLHEKRGLLL